MVWSRHSVDGVPTTEHPYPSVYKGNDKPSSSTRRKLIRMEVSKVAIDSGEGLNQMECSDSQTVDDHCYTLTGDPCVACLDNNNVIYSLARKKEKLSKKQ